MTITPDALAELPFHDATMLAWTFTRSESDELIARLALILHEDEDWGQLRKMGIDQYRVMIVFENCWLIRSELCGNQDAKEYVSSIDLEDNSSLIASLLGRGVGNGKKAHCVITTSHGSRVDVVSEAVRISENS